MKTNDCTKYLALIALTCSIAACKRDAPQASESATSAAAAASADAASKVITPGIYEVCDIANTDMHGDLKRDHLTGKKVEIQQIQPDALTVVCLAEEGCPDDLANPENAEQVLWMGGDQKELRVVHSFEHEDTHAGGTAHELHLVKILKDPTDMPPATCKKANVLLMRICSPDQDAPSLKWRCASSAGPHGADAHIEN